ncbi:MAG: 30S ribosomal protein S8 [Candidatus Paceibacterota bacterium]
MVTDPIADMLIQLKNAAMAGKPTVAIPHSQLKMSIAKLLRREGYLLDVAKRGKKVGKVIVMTLATSPTGNRKLIQVKRVSKPSKRIYQGFEAIKQVKQGQGLSIISTPRGLLTDREAKREKVGGEVLFSIW